MLRHDAPTLSTEILKSQCRCISATVPLTFENACLVFVDAVFEAQVCCAHRFFEAHPRTKILKSQRRSTFAMKKNARKSLREYSLSMRACSSRRSQCGC